MFYITIMIDVYCNKSTNEYKFVVMSTLSLSGDWNWNDYSASCFSKTNMCMGVKRPCSPPSINAMPVSTNI